MKLKRFTLLLLMGCCLNLHAQIGYQISLLNTATGEPRANETVNVTVTLTNSEGGIIYTGNQSATTNDFGVLSLTIGDSNTFKEVDLTKLPFFIEVSANGVMIGKSQVLNVPVAEVAKRLAPLDEDLLSGTWNGIIDIGASNSNHEVSLSFKKNGIASYILKDRIFNTDGSLYMEEVTETTCKYLLEGNSIILYDCYSTITTTYYYGSVSTGTSTSSGPRRYFLLIYNSDKIIDITNTCILKRE